MAASGTGIEMAAQGRRAAAGEGPQDSQLLKAQPRDSVEEAVTLRAKDVGHLHGGPVHSGLKPSATGGVRCTGNLNASSGFGAACRCFCETCRYTAVCARSA